MQTAARSSTRSSPTVAFPRRGMTAWARRAVLSDHFVLLLTVGYFAAVAPFTPGMATPENLTTLAAYALPAVAAGVGLTVVLIGGGIDLSITSIIALASVVGAKVMSTEGGWLAGEPLAVPAAIMTMVAVGATAGVVNGISVAVLQIPAFMATLATMMFASGLALWITLSRKIGGLPASFVELGHSLPFALAVSGAAAAVMHVALSRTVYGQWLYATGQNARAALLSGVPTRRLVFFTYVASGALAGVSAVLFTGALETGNPEMAQGSLLDIVGGVVLGGTSLYGGRGKIPGTVYGMLFLALVDNSMNLLGLTYYTIIAVKGGVILAAALLDVARSRIAAEP